MMSRTIVFLLAALLMPVTQSSVLAETMVLQESVPPPTLTVKGQAEVASPPDLAIIRLGTISQAAQADVAQSQVNQVMQQALLAIARLGILQDQIQTVGLQLSPVYSNVVSSRSIPQATESRIVGYRASNAVQVRLENLAMVGQVIDAAVTAGANQLENLSFELKNDGQYRQRALSLAAAQARSKAEEIAKALGVKIIAVQQVQEVGVDNVRPMVYARREMAASGEAAPTPIQAGEVRVEATVTVTYKISGGAIEEDKAKE